MARPKTGYRLSDNTRVPGVTTITGRFKDSGALIAWAWKEGSEGRDYRKSRDDAADIGTQIHEAIELYLRDQDLPTMPEPVAVGFGGFREWWEQTKLEVVDLEVSLVSEKHQFGGTMDLVAQQSGKLALGDWKSGRVYSDHLLQIAAYRQLYEEAHGKRVERCHLFRFDKEWGSFSHFSFGREQIDVAWEQFLLFRRAYDIDKQLRKMV